MLPNVSKRSIIALSLGAIAGALLRFYLTELVRQYWATFAINITGCFLIAYILTLAGENIRSFSPELRLMLTTGFCGAYTTFSTYALETTFLLEKEGLLLALVYSLGSISLGMVGVRLGVLLARRTN